MVQPVFAAFPDPEKDPRHYLVRYYTEPDYQAWFDKSYPNDTIEDKVGYSKKIVTDDYYVDDAFEFALKYPSMYWELDDISIDESVRALAGIYFWTNEQIENQEYGGGFLVYYKQNNPMDVPDDLLYWYSEYPAGSVTVKDDNVTSQLKINNQFHENDGTRDIIRYEYTTSEYYSSDFWIEELAGKKLVDRNVIVIFLYPNGDEYELVFSAANDSYPQLINEFNIIADSFYVGETEKLSDLLADYAPEVKSAAAESSGGCGPGTVLVNGVCELKQEVKSEPIQTSEGCGPGTTMVNGVCELKEASSTYQSPLHWWHIVAVLAIGGIIAGVVVVNRGSKSAEPKEEPKEQPKEEPKKELSRFCENCGNQLKPTAKFCGKCGTQRS